MPARASRAAPVVRIATLSALLLALGAVTFLGAGLVDPWDARLEGDGLWRVEVTLPHVGHAFLLARSATGRMVMLWLGVAALLAVALGLVVRRGADVA